MDETARINTMCDSAETSMEAAIKEGIDAAAESDDKLAELERENERLRKIIDLAMSGADINQADSDYCELCRIYTFRDEEGLSKCLCDHEEN